VLSGMFHLCDAPGTGLRALVWAASSILSMSAVGWVSSDIADTGMQPQTPRDAHLVPTAASLCTPVNRLVGLARGDGCDADDMPAAYIYVSELLQ
jgi:hypothetical protein